MKKDIIVTFKKIFKLTKPQIPFKRHNYFDGQVIRLSVKFPSMM